MTLGHDFCVFLAGALFGVIYATIQDAMRAFREHDEAASRAAFKEGVDSGSDL